MGELALMVWGGGWRPCVYGYNCDGDFRRMSSKKWLAQHGLAAKKLTVIDLLAPTFISHQPRYVSTIDRTVLSRVFDDVRFCQ